MALIPNVNRDVHISPKIFGSKQEAMNYLLHEVGQAFHGQSENVKEKDYFHKFNYVIPYIKIMNVQAKRKECGSMTSNQRDRNKAIVANETDPAYSFKYGFPINKDCYGTYISGELQDNYLYNGQNSKGEPLYTPYTDSSSSINGGWGLIN